jgi:hypothetical protein
MEWKINYFIYILFIYFILFKTHSHATVGKELTHQVSGSNLTMLEHAPLDLGKMKDWGIGLPIFL